MEEMIARWIQETITELQRAKENLNFLKMQQMIRLEKALKEIREKLFN